MNSREIEDICELSPLQQGMLFHTLYEPESRLYFEQVVVPFESHLNLPAFEQAWRRLADNHSVLRTSFHWEEIEKPVQVVHKKAVIPVETRDLRGIPEFAQAIEIERLLEADRRRGFDMNRPPLVRLTLVQTADTAYKLLLSFHHTILDGWSLQVLFRQFSHAYQAISLGGTPNLPESRPFSDYMRWLQKQNLGAAENYWRKVLTGTEGTSAIHASADAGNRSEGYSEYEISLSKSATTRLRDFASSRKLTLNTLVQAAWGLLISRLSGSSDVVFGVTVSGRPAELRDVENMVGLFINTVPVRMKIGSNALVTEWLQAVQTQQFEARQYDCSPLIRIREWSGLPGSGPLFDTLVAFENYPVEAREMDGAVAATFVERTNYALSAAIVPRQHLQIRLLYNLSILPSEAVAGIADQFAVILQTLTQEGSPRIGDLDILTEVDRVLFSAVNQTRTSYPDRSTVTELWCEQVNKSPSAPALDFAIRKMTYAELDRMTDHLASRLRSLGVRRESRVALLFPRSTEFIVSALAVLKAGGTYTPIDTAYPPSRIDSVISDTGARVLLTNADVTRRYSLQCENVLIVEHGSLPSPDDAVMPPEAGKTSDDAAYVMYTSGSTGEPKGIVVPHRGIIRLVRNTNYVDIQPSSRIGHLSNCAFDAATFEIWGALLNGACVVGIEPEVALSPLLLQAELEKRQVSVLFLTTALFNQVVAEVPDAFRSLDALLFGGEAVDPRRVRGALRAGAPRRLCHVYGPTETTTFATCHVVAEVPSLATNIPIGRPISNTTTYVLDDALRPIPAGGIGELYVGGDGLARAYHGKPAVTAERFIPDPFSDRAGARMYRTGDKVRWCTDGSIEFMGRYDTQVKLRGYRIELEEIERRLQKNSQVRQAAVIVREDQTGEQTLAAYVVPEGVPVEGLSHDLRRALRNELPEYMQPNSIHVLASLPLNPNGKIDYGALPEPDAQSAGPYQEFREPDNEIERKLLSIWQKVLGHERIGIHDVFFDIGGHSLRATQLVSHIRRDLGAEIPLRAVFEKPTIAELALLIRQTGEAPAGSPGIAPIPRQNRRSAET